MTNIIVTQNNYGVGNYYDILIKMYCISENPKLSN